MAYRSCLAFDVIDVFDVFDVFNFFDVFVVIDSYKVVAPIPTPWIASSFPTPCLRPSQVGGIFFAQ